MNGYDIKKNNCRINAKDTRSLHSKIRVYMFEKRRSEEIRVSEIQELEMAKKCLMSSMSEKTVPRCGKKVIKKLNQG